MLTRVRYELRALPLSLVAGAVALSIAPAVLVLLRGGEELSQSVVAGLVVGGGATALAAVEPAAEVLAPVPVPLARRWGTRLGVLAAVVALAWLTVLVAVLWRDPHAAGSVGDRLGEVAAVAGLSAAAGAAADRRGQPVVPAALAGPLAVLIVTTMAYRYDLPRLGGPGDGTQWLGLAAVAWAAALWERRDPYGFARPRLSR